MNKSLKSLAYQKPRSRIIVSGIGARQTIAARMHRSSWSRNLRRCPRQPKKKVAAPERPAEAAPVPQVSMATPDGVYSILEEATKSKNGIEAICTGDAILCLWNWGCADDLRRARAAINFLIKRLEG